MTQLNRDVDLTTWLDKIAYHPAPDPAKQVAHSILRQAVANLGGLIHPLVPASDDKSTAFRLLGDFLMYANRALAVHGVPDIGGDTVQNLAALRMVLNNLEQEAAALETLLQRDARYEARQQADPEPAPAGRGLVVTPAAEPGGVADQTPLSPTHHLDVPSNSTAHVRVGLEPGAVTLQILDPNGIARFSEPDKLSVLLQTIAGAGNNAYQ